MRFGFPLLVAAALCAGTTLLPAHGGDAVRVQLKWRHQFQFAGYYAAIAQGYYRDAGLDVQLIEGAPNVDPAKVVLDGHAEYGVGTPDLLLQRAAGAPVVVLGAIFQHSPYIFLVLEGHDIDDVTDFTGRRVTIEPQAAELYAYLQRERVETSQLTLVPHTFSTAALTSGAVDVMSAYATDEPFTLEKEKRHYLVFTPRAGGVDFYGDCFFTTEKEIRDHSARVRAFRTATLRGWDYALKHPDEIIDLLLTKYHASKSREALRFEADRMRELIHPELIPVGYMYEGRWQHIMETYEELGMLKAPIPLDGFLYNPDPKPDLAVFYWVTAGALFVALATWGVLLPIWRLNGRLRREVMERIEAEEMLEAARDAALLASQAKMEFLTHISHDLRTPLSSIIMQAEILNFGQLDAETKAGVHVIHEAGEHLLTLVNDILDMNRLEAGRIEMADVPFRLEDALNPVVEVLGISAQRKGLVLSSVVEPGLPGLHGDPDRLRQILFNVVGNAVKFTDHGAVDIRAAHRDGSWIRITVSDTGPGIAPADLANIFDPFTRASTPILKPKEGSGLGLAIVRRLAEAMGGTVGVESTPGTGSTFTLDLPLAIEGSATTKL